MGLEVRAISDKHNIKIAIVDLTDGFKEIVKLQKTKHDCSNCIRKKTLANTTLMSLSIKEGDRLNVTINGMGLCGNVVAEFDNNTFRGYIQNPRFKHRWYYNRKKVIQVRYRKR
jgi:molecular chaperone Hsp33